MIQNQNNGNTEVNKSDNNIEDLNKELWNANRKLQASEAFKSHFLSHISNELFNPFTSIVGMSKNILRKDKLDEKEVRKMVEFIHSESHYLEFQLKNLFTAAQVESGEMALEIGLVSPTKIINHCISKFESELLKKNIKVQLESTLTDDFTFKTDNENVLLVLNNLLSNAIKYSNSDETIKLSACTVDNKLEIKISNKGDHITDEINNAIFDRFSRLSPEINSINQGTGVGLSVCKSILDLLQGEIEYETIENRMVFKIVIPESSANFEAFDISEDDIFFDD